MSTELSESCGPADIDRAATVWADLGGATFVNFAGHAATPRMAVAAACASAALKGRPVGGDAAGFFDPSERVRPSLAQLQVARMLVMVNGAPGSNEPHRIANGASELLVEVFGRARPSRPQRPGRRGSSIWGRARN